MKIYKLKIEHPCEQSWEEMKSTEGGKHCMHCSKTVIDFTNLTDKQIIDIIFKSSGGLCGRLTRDQLNTTISFKKEVSYPTIFSKIAASFLLIGLSQPATAHNSKNTFTSEIQFPVRTKKQKTDPQTISEDSIKTIYGIIADAETHKTIPLASILIKNSGRLVISERNGYFQFSVSLQQSAVDLEVTAFGYLKQEVHLNIDTKFNSTILLVPDPNQPDKIEFIMGKMAAEPSKNHQQADRIKGTNISQPKQSKKKWWQLRKK